MMLKKMKSFNIWVKIGIVWLAAALVFLIIGLGCFGAKINISGNFEGKDFTYCSNFYHEKKITVVNALNNNFPDSSIPIPDIYTYTSNIPEAWRVGAAFTVILTPFFGGISLFFFGYGIYKGKK